MRRWHGLVALAVGATIVGGGAVSARTTQPTNDRSPTSVLIAVRGEAMRLTRFIGLDDEAPVAPGTLDDGAELRPQATISLEDAIALAQASSTGTVGEVDLEYVNGTLVFNVDVGDSDVKVDANDGAILGVDHDG